MEIVGLAIAAFALIPVGFFVYDRYFRKRARIDVDVANIFLASFDCPSSKSNGNLGIGLYNMKISNISASAFTMTDAILIYVIEGHRYECISHVVQTGTTPTQTPAVALKCGNNNIIVGDWYNLRTELNKHQTLEPGAVFSASAYYVLQHGVNNLDDIKSVELLLKDHAGRRSTYRLDIELARNNFRGKNMMMINVPFKDDGKGNISFS